MRFTRRPRAPYTVTDRKRAAAIRWQQRQRDALPLLAPLIAEAQPTINAVMADRVVRWDCSEQASRNRRARQWRDARNQLDRRYEPTTRAALLLYWNTHRWLPGDPVYLLDGLHGFDTGRLVLRDGRIVPKRDTITVEEAVAAFGPAKPLARGWLGPARGAGPPQSLRRRS